jgi:hypothetical protein
LGSIQINENRDAQRCIKVSLTAAAFSIGIRQQ